MMNLKLLDFLKSEIDKKTAPGGWGNLHKLGIFWFC